MERSTRPPRSGSRPSRGRLVEVKREAKIVGEILRQRESGASLAEIAESLNAQGIDGKRGGRWYASTVRYLIQRQAA